MNTNTNKLICKLLNRRIHVDDFIEAARHEVYADQRRLLTKAESLLEQKSVELAFTPQQEPIVSMLNALAAELKSLDSSRANDKAESLV